MYVSLFFLFFFFCSRFYAACVRCVYKEISLQLLGIKKNIHRHNAYYFRFAALTASGCAQLKCKTLFFYYFVWSLTFISLPSVRAVLCNKQFLHHYHQHEVNSSIKSTFFNLCVQHDSAAAIYAIYFLQNFPDPFYASHEAHQRKKRLTRENGEMTSS